MRIETRILAGTTILAALVVVFDYSMKFSGLKMPFPWLPTLKFDFTGIPIALAYFLFGFVPGVFTSVIAFVAILARSGDVVASSMKALAELSTVVGMALAFRLVPRFSRVSSFLLGVLARCSVMFFANLVVLPSFYHMPFAVAVSVSPLIVAFNVLQGSLGILGGYFLHEALRRRVPSLVKRS